MNKSRCPFLPASSSVPRWPHCGGRHGPAGDTLRLCQHIWGMTGVAELNEHSLRPTETPRPEPDAAGAVQTGRGTPGEGQSHRQETEEGRCLQIRVQYRQKQKRGTQGCVNTGQRNPREKTGGRFRNLPAPTFKASIKGTR